MLGKPIQLAEARDLYQNGLKIVSCYQFGKQGTADWLGGQNAGVQHAVGASGTEKLPMSFVLQQTSVDLGAVGYAFAARLATRKRVTQGCWHFEKS